MDKYLEHITAIIERAIKRKNITAAKASREAVGNPWMVRNMKVGKSPRIENLKKLCDFLGLELYIGWTNESPGLDTNALIIGTTKGEIVQCKPLTELSEDKKNLNKYPKAPSPTGKSLLIGFTIGDSSLAPVFVCGDTIYADLEDKRDSSQWEKFIGHLCIVQLRDGTIRLRILRRGDSVGLWNLEALSHERNTLVDYDPEICLPVRWVKKSDPY